MVTWSNRETTCNDLDESNLNTYLLSETAWSALLRMLQLNRAAASLTQETANHPSGQMIHPISPFVPRAQPRAQL